MMNSLLKNILVLIAVSLLLWGCDAASITSPGENGGEENGIFATIIGGSADDSGSSVIQTSDGGFLVAGTFSSLNGDFGGLSIGSQDIFAAKLDATGSVDWIRSFGGNNIDGATDVIEDSEGNFVIAGFSSSNTGTFSGLNRGNRDAALLKISPTGTFIWARTYGGFNNEEAAAVVEGPQGGYAITGYTRSFDGNFSFRDNASSDIFLIFTDSNGQPVWFRSYGGTSDDEGLDLTISSQDRIAVTGSFTSFDGIFNNVQLGQTSFFLLESELDGDFFALTTYGGSGLDFGHSVISTSDGGFAIAGASNSNTIHFDALNKGNFDAFIMKLNAGRSIEWVNNYGGGGIDRAFGISEKSDGGYLIAGETVSNNDDFEGLNRGGFDLFILDSDENGIALSSLLIGGSNDETATAILEQSDGSFALSGSTRSSDGDFSTRNSSDRDVLLITGGFEP
jgi:hypothetical protein